jgi:N-acetylated-alpha-linked acidic dipeptidase
LSKNCIAYINVDESTNGGRFLGALGSPLLDAVLRSSAAAVPSPIYDDKTVYDDWLEDLRRSEAHIDKPSLALLGTGSDYTAFAHHLGIPSIDMLFNRQGQGVYPYHSNYDSYYWIDKFGDVGFRKHKAMAQLWGLVAVKLACAALIPFDVTDYPAAISRNFRTLRDQNPQLDTVAFERALNKFTASASQFKVNMDGGVADYDLAIINNKLIALERAFLLEKGSGLKGRPWYRHQVYFSPPSRMQSRAPLLTARRYSRQVSGLGTMVYSCPAFKKVSYRRTLLRRIAL